MSRGPLILKECLFHTSARRGKDGRWSGEEGGGRKHFVGDIDFWGRIVAFVLWYLYTYSVLLIINGCLSHTSAWWGKDEHWAGDEGRGWRRRRADFRKSRFITFNGTFALIIYSSSGEQRNIVQFVLSRKGWALGRRGGKRSEARGPADSLQAAFQAKRPNTTSTTLIKSDPILKFW